jgi:lipopolysaccharide/colanic/teichoic acid biosynthesis glycosyltransferase
MKAESYRPFKRFIDLSGALFLFILFSPIIILASILVKLSSPGPIIFTQKRVGLKGKEFIFYKFRTMYIGDNDERLKKYPELWEKYKKSDWKLPMNEDPRITPIGKKLRNLTIDEFPQILNVLKGDMSLVGPRAYRLAELKEQGKKYPQTKKLIKTILTVQPGLTGPWQVSGRNVILFPQRAKLDANYAQNLSLLNDLAILIKTPAAMLSKW